MAKAENNRKEASANRGIVTKWPTGWERHAASLQTFLILRAYSRLAVCSVCVTRDQRWEGATSRCHITSELLYHSSSIFEEKPRIDRRSADRSGFSET